MTGARGWHAATLGYNGGVQVVWLDGRNAAPMAHEHGKGASKPVRTPGGPRQDIFHASWKGDSRPVEHLIQANVCFCCKTAVVASGEKVYAAWRHIYPGSLRDIAVARSMDNGATFGDPIRVSEDGWKIDACPDDGPAMVADGHSGIHIAWPTLVAGATRTRASSIRHSRATLLPRAFVLIRARPIPAHPQIAADEHTNTAVVDEQAGDTRRIVFRAGVGRQGGSRASLSRRRSELSGRRGGGRVFRTFSGRRAARQIAGHRGPATSCARAPLTSHHCARARCRLPPSREA